MNRESPSSMRRRGVASLTAVFALTLLWIIIGVYSDFGLVEIKTVTAKNKIPPLSPAHRKLLSHGESQGKSVEPNRIWSEKCSKSDIVISQGATEPLPNGIPTYTVEIMNTCASGCDIYRIHLSCGWFSSARLVNPQVFKRLRFDDCLVNDGKALVNGRTLSFQYANTFRYPLAVSSVGC